MTEVIIYISIIAIVAVLVFINYKKSHGNYRGRKNKSFRDSYLEKKRNKKDNENLH